MSTADLPGWAPPEVDPFKPSAARVYDYWLGGGCNFEVDRRLAKQVIERVPEVQESAVINRSFLRRAVRYCAERGIRQFLDIGAGVPTVGHVHEVAQAVDPSCRTVYVDNEPVAVAHGVRLVANDPNTACITGNIRNPGAIMADATATGLLDPDEPVAVLMLLVLHFVGPDEGVPRLLRKYRDAVMPGSYLALSHVTADGLGDRTQSAADLYKDTQNPVYTRDRQEFTALFDGLELVDPGVVYTAQWRPESEEEAAAAERSQAYAGLAQKII